MNNGGKTPHNPDHRSTGASRLRHALDGKSSATQGLHHSAGERNNGAKEIQEDGASAKSLGKRKLSLSDDFEEKVTWTDDEDENPNDRKKEQRRGGTKKRRATNTTTAKNKTPGRTAKSTKNGTATSSGKGMHEDSQIPDYLRERRRQFEKDRETLRDHHHAGLKLPPDYSEHVYFSDDERLLRLEERPRFDDSSGIKPCRPYKDVELEYSAGLIPASIAQYLRDYQITGVQFLHRLFVYQKGGILGDDMGLGKTVQVAAFLTAAFGKTGDERDAKRMRKMRRSDGNLWYPRVLIICPGSLIQNWKNELNRWGWWHVDLYHGPGKEDVLQTAKAGRLEIMITTYTTYKKSYEAVNEVQWDCVVADECHVLKDRRSETTRAMDEVNALCRIGLTGTAIQNKYEELWTLLNWTNPGHFGTIQEWTATITKPLTVGQSHDATLYQLSLARTTAKKLVQNLLPDFFLRRMKTLIADQLPKKSDKVVFCPLTDVQREAYENFLGGYQVTFINSVTEPCDCGSGRKKGWCCYKTDGSNGGKSWMSLVFPSIMNLQKVANHLTLLIPSSGDPTDKQKTELATLQTCVPDEWEDLWRNRDSMLNLANPEFCGKWKILRKLLRFWHENGDKVLVFSHSVRLLRILQHLFHNTSYTVSFLDGSLSYEDRQKVVDDFNSDPGQFVFLISTKAGGVGLNITSANKVVIFDPHWNPSYDLQAQDRAYRIGQVRDVDVFRLVSAGTIEEIVYARQIYKQQQANIGYNASNERRYFKGVQQDATRKGEIFGLGNLFSFHADQVVLREIVNKTNIAEAKAGVSLTEIDVSRVGKTEEGGEEDDLAALVKEEEPADDEVGMSQLAKLLTAENQQELLQAKKQAKPKSDAIAAILASAGVEYTHENSEVIGTSKVEAQLSRRAELAATEGNAKGKGKGSGVESGVDSGALFADTTDDDGFSEVGEGGLKRKVHYRFNPPLDVMRRQFCSMAREFGFPNATDFALVVESWTQEQRRNCLDTFYRIREVKLLEEQIQREKRRIKNEEGGEESDEDEDEEAFEDRKGAFRVNKEEEQSKDVDMDRIKGEGVKMEDIKKEDVKLKETGTDTDMDLDAAPRMPPGLTEVKEEKQEDPVEAKVKIEPAAKEKDSVNVKTEKAEEKKVYTIFLSDDDEDDEL
ncbi:P-loop containing nucleoside triphosphate hydrolase protein [Diplogelasinospora grovesii]|uniref:P-loop containing nucleoside triphosphate hydrolase protein n=1 Tax=Diplogelasinospora grovesii TaxID=303347 RepID=A0AAN6S8M4_9PEZI|nr:P-loop containing nucleoside triphosphate hydrolase protein [Diplogelasinospora grovesii]